MILRNLQLKIILQHKHIHKKANINQKKKKQKGRKAVGEEKTVQM